MTNTNKVIWGTAWGVIVAVTVILMSYFSTINTQDKDLAQVKLDFKDAASIMGSRLTAVETKSEQYEKDINDINDSLDEFRAIQIQTYQLLLNKQKNEVAQY